MVVRPNISSHNKKNSVTPVITGKEEYFIALFCIKTMLKMDIISDLFGISRTVVSNICVTWWKFLANELKHILSNPPEEAHRALLPDSFKTPQYRKVQHIVDGTGVFIETPKNKSVQAVLWSNYKHYYTCTFLVGIAPNGLINFASKGYGRKASDQQIVENSGFLDEVRERRKSNGRQGI